MRRDAFSLFEVTLVSVLLAACAMAVGILAPLGATQSISAAAESRMLVAALRSARQTAVASGLPTRVRFVGSRNVPSGYVIEQLHGGHFDAMHEQQSISELPLMQCSAMEITFLPTGSADHALDVRLGNGRQQHQVNVVPANGLVRYVKG